MSPALRALVFGSLAALVLAVAVTAIVMGLGIYRWNWTGPASKMAVRTFSVPVGSVNGVDISYAELLDDVDTLTRYFGQVLPEGDPGPTEQEMRQQAFEKLVSSEVLRQEARRLGVEVTDEDIEDEFGRLVERTGSIEKVRAELELMYGWDEATFKEKVLKPYLTQLEIEDALRNDEEVRTGALAEAEEVLEMIRAGEDFGKLAARYSDDPGTAQVGGKLGEFGRGVMVPEFETVAFALEVGAVSGIVETMYGYHIVKVDDEVVEDGERVKVSASHILISFPQIEDYLEEKIDQAVVEEFIEL